MRATLPHIAALRDTGGLALVSPGSPRPPDPLANAYATLSAGDVINTRNPHLGLLERALAAAHAEDRAVLIQFGDTGAQGRLQALDSVLGQVEAGEKPGDKIMVCSVAPPQDAHGSWDRLTVVLVSGPGAPGETLTSDTTHTPGLIALRDIAPTLLSWANVPIPVSMTGAPAQPLAVADRTTLLARMDSLTRLNQHILLPLAWFLGWFGGLALFGTVWTLASGRRFWPAGLRYLLRAVIAFPLAVLIAPALDPQTLPIYTALIIALDLLLAAIPSAGAICALTAGVIVLDGFAGAHLVAQTALSGYWLPGIRFYGIGNEYMGVLLGTVLMAPVLFRSPHPPAPSPVATRDGEPTIAGSFPDQGAAIKTLPHPVSGGVARRAGLGLALWFIVVITALSFPQFGAKAGGAVTAMVCFAPAWFALVLGKRIGWVSFLVSAAAGFALVFAFAAVSHMLGLRETHIQAASGALAAGRFGYIWHVALRKVKMAVKIFLHPGVFLTLAGLGLTYAIWRRSKLPEQMKAYLSNRPALALTLRAGAWGVLACVLFNDSGTVAAFFLFGVLILSFLHEMLPGPISRDPALNSRTILAETAPSAGSVVSASERPSKEG